VYRDPSSTVLQVPWTGEATTKAARWVLLAWLVGVAVVVFEPTPAIATGTVHDLSDRLLDLGLPRLIARGS